MSKCTVSEYKDAYLVDWGKTVDVVDKQSGKWSTHSSTHAAKWNLSVWRRLSNTFTADQPHPAVG